MHLYATIITSLFGLGIGSFLNVVILRLPHRASLQGRSHCNSCKKTLRWLELIPIISFVLQKGRCRTCGTVLSWQYPIVEAITALLFGAFFWHTPQLLEMGGYTLSTLHYALFILGGLVAIAASVAIFVIDLKHQIIATQPLIALLIAAITLTAFRLLSDPAPSNPVKLLSLDVGTAGILALFLGALWFFSRGTWMGFGDVKLIFATSLLIGFPAALTALIYSFWIGGAMGMLLLIFKKKSLGSKIPFGPFILLGTAIAFLWPQWSLEYWIF